MYTITVESDKPMVVISQDEYEGMRETIELLTENPNLLAELNEIRERMRRGEGISLEDFKKKYKVV